MAKIIGTAGAAPKARPKLKPFTPPKPEVAKFAPPKRTLGSDLAKLERAVGKPTVKKVQAKVKAATQAEAPLRTTRRYSADRGTGTSRALESAFGFEKKVTKKLVAPGLKALQATTIPLHAVAGAALRAEGRGLAGLTPAQLVKGAEEGVKHKTTYSNVLAQAGVKNKTAQAIGGLAGDVLLDPLTYATFGAAVPAAKIAQRAGRAAYREAVTKGAAHADATKIAEQAAQKAEKAGPQNKGLTVAAFGKSSSGRTTAAVSRKTGISRLTTKVRESAPVQALAKDIRPSFRPKGLSEQEHQAIRGASREARAQTTRGRVAAVAKAKALRDALPKEDYARVVSAIERGTVYDLPGHLWPAARDVELTFRQARKSELGAGIQVPNRRRYFTHAIEDVQGAGEVARRQSGRRVIRPEYAKGRQYGGSVEQIAASGGPQFSTNVPRVVSDRMARSARDVAQARFNRTLLNTGRKVPEGAQEVALEPHEALYRIKGASLEKIARKDERGALAGETQNLRVLNQHAVDQAYKAVAPAAERGALGTAYDKVQGGFKFIATAPNPGFHARNLYGDTGNAYLGQAAPKLAANLGRSARGLKALGQQEKALRTLAPAGEGVGNKAARRMGQAVADTRQKLPGLYVKGKYGGKDFLTYDQLASEAVQSGGIRSGFLSKEIPELVRTSGKAPGREHFAGLKRIAQNREDLPRLATYIGARRRGLGAREAADWVAQHHFDYADLTGFERNVARRLMPFYTWSARNIPLQAKRFLTNPGKYANFEKAREEFAKAIGLPPDWQSRIPEYQQRGMPLPIKLGDHIFLVSASLPITDLNQLTIPGVTTKTPWTASVEQLRKFASLLNPVIKDPVELAANYSFFFRGPIQNQNAPLVAAPSYVALFPKAWRDKLGIVPDYTDRSGRKGWGWPAKVDYAAKVIPGPVNMGQQLASPLSNRRGQGLEGKLFSYIVGLKPDPYAPPTAAIGNAYSELAKLEERRAALRQRGQGSAQSGLHETPEFVQVRDRIKALTNYIGVLKTQRGDKGAKVKAAAGNPFDGIEPAAGGNPFDSVPAAAGARNPFD